MNTNSVKSFWAFLWPSVIVFLVLVTTLELALRADLLQPFLQRMTPNLGSRHLQLEEQLARLERFSTAEGHVDCIFLGSSLVWLGFDPAVFEDAFEDETGYKLRCFNLGVEALPANAAAALAQVVVQEYQPWLLIYGTSARDYTMSRIERESRDVLETPWLRGKLGKPSLRSWLVQDSYLIKYSKALSRLLLLEQHTWSYLRNPDVSKGLLVKTTTAQPVHYQAAAVGADKWLRPYLMQEDNLRGLSTILNQRAKGSEVIVAEMPVNERYFDYFQNGRSDYDKFVRQVSEIAAAEDGVFLGAPPRQTIPDNGWWDWNHMNIVGAEAFSRWMAERVAGLLTAGTLTTPN